MNDFNYIKHSIKGTKRDDNQDDLLIIDTDYYQLFVVLDGVGSALNAKRAIESTKLFISDNYNKYLQFPENSINKMMFDVNEHLLSLNLPEVLTTYSLLLISKKDKKIHISNLGDSRIYGISKQYLKILSRDDNIVANSNVITKCLGMELDYSNFSSINIEESFYRYLLCTDGFYNLLDKEKLEFFNILNGTNFSKIKDRLNNRIEGLNKDDSTYIILEV